MVRAGEKRPVYSWFDRKKGQLKLYIAVESRATRARFGKSTYRGGNLSTRCTTRVKILFKILFKIEMKYYVII